MKYVFVYAVRCFIVKAFLVDSKSEFEKKWESPEKVGNTRGSFCLVVHYYL